MWPRARVRRFGHRDPKERLRSLDHRFCGASCSYPVIVGRMPRKPQEGPQLPARQHARGPDQLAGNVADVTIASLPSADRVFSSCDQGRRLEDAIVPPPWSPVSFLAFEPEIVQTIGARPLTPELEHR